MDRGCIFNINQSSDGFCADDGRNRLRGGCTNENDDGKEKSNEGKGGNSKK